MKKAIIYIKAIVLGLIRAVYCFLAAWLSLFIAAAFCEALSLEAGTTGARIVFWAMMIIQTLFFASIYILLQELRRKMSK